MTREEADKKLAKISDSSMVKTFDSVENVAISAAKPIRRILQ
jgi:hypothetical protein